MSYNFVAYNVVAYNVVAHIMVASIVASCIVASSIVARVSSGVFVSILSISSTPFIRAVQVRRSNSVG